MLREPFTVGLGGERQQITCFPLRVLACRVEDQGAPRGRVGTGGGQLRTRCGFTNRAADSLRARSRAAASAVSDRPERVSWARHNLPCGVVGRGKEHVGMARVGKVAPAGQRATHEVFAGRV